MLRPPSVEATARGAAALAGVGAGVWADPAVSLLISVLVLFAAWQLIRDAVDILMEGAPDHLDVDEIREALLRHPGVIGIHDLHVWTIGNGEIALSSHLVAPTTGDHHVLLRDARSLLGEFLGEFLGIEVQPLVEMGADIDHEARAHGLAALGCAAAARQ